ncbi:Copine_I [Hexamita inflata]|uniref:Copine I n=1 Tax=Hexamita inflata TaxID=28002 RepID=A0AA86QJC3_9EUKA|nr:Copine I [Hexamita inflata]
MSKVPLTEDKINTYSQLMRQMQLMGQIPFRTMFALDFSLSNSWIEPKNIVHNPTSDKNPYKVIMQYTQTQVGRVLKNSPVFGYRFGCKHSEDMKCCPLAFPENQNAQFETFDALIEGYKSGLKQTTLFGPTILTQVFKEAIQVQTEYCKKDPLVCIIVTDGDIDDVEIDGEMLIQASKYPICFVCIGVGNGQFTKMKLFDDLKGRKFDNFQFLQYNEVERKMEFKCERPDQTLALEMFKELPAAIQKMKKAGII